MSNTKYRAIFSTDWSECLSPTGPFDPIAFVYPELAQELEPVFRLYTSNQISLSEAAKRVRALLPAPLHQEQMDAYLQESFVTYNGVKDLINWCLENQVLFMINTTASIGYFQRVFAQGLLPNIPALSGHPMIKYPPLESDPVQILELHEIDDKARNTQRIAEMHGIPTEKVIIMGDSGGDGPHFNWGARVGALLIGCMSKQSLQAYCHSHGISVHHYFGIVYGPGEKRDPEKEMKFDFTELIHIVKQYI